MLQSRRLGRDGQLQKAEKNSPALRPGTKGTGVAILQDLLADLGFDLPNTLRLGRPDGRFGPETEKAVKGFQRRRGLFVDGVAGHDTLAALDQLVRRNAALESGDGVEDRARELQDALLPVASKRSAYW